MLAGEAAQLVAGPDAHGLEGQVQWSRGLQERAHVLEQQRLSLELANHLSHGEPIPSLAARGPVARSPLM